METKIELDQITTYGLQIFLIVCYTIKTFTEYSERQIDPCGFLRRMLVYKFKVKSIIDSEYALS